MGVLPTPSYVLANARAPIRYCCLHTFVVYTSGNGRAHSIAHTFCVRIHTAARSRDGIFAGVARAAREGIGRPTGGKARLEAGARSRARRIHQEAIRRSLQARADVRTALGHRLRGGRRRTLLLRAHPEGSPRANHDVRWGVHGWAVHELSAEERRVDVRDVLIHLSAMNTQKKEVPRRLAP